MYASNASSNSPTPESREKSITTWGTRLAMWDETPQALQLLTTTELTSDNRHFRAQLLFQSGKPTEAIAVLDDGAQRGLPSDQFTNDDALRAACWAATKHEGAYGWLRSRVLSMTPGQFPYGQWLLAHAADAIGDTATADQMWRALGAGDGVLTWDVVAHFTAALSIETRNDLLNGSSKGQVAASFVRLVQNTEFLPNRLEQDPRPIIRAHELLVQRGEKHAALMLLTAARFVGAPSKTIADEYKRSAPRLRMTWYASLALFSVVFATCLAVSLPKLGIALGLGSIYLWRRFMPMRGFTLKEAHVLRILRQLRFDRRTRTPVARGLSGIANRDATPFLFGLAAFAVAWIVGALAVAKLAPGGLDNSLGVGLSVVVAVVGAVVGYQFGVRRAQAKLAPKQPAVVTCRCATAVALSGVEAGAYATHHLVATDAPPIIAASRELKCPTLGTPWLLVAVTGEGAVYLMRGATETLDADLPVDEPREGFYL